MQAGVILDADQLGNQRGEQRADFKERKPEAQGSEEAGAITSSTLLRVHLLSARNPAGDAMDKEAVMGRLGGSIG